MFLWKRLFLGADLLGSLAFHVGDQETILTHSTYAVDSKRPQGLAWSVPFNVLTHHAKLFDAEAHFWHPVNLHWLHLAAASRFLSVDCFQNKERILISDERCTCLLICGGLAASSKSWAVAQYMQAAVVSMDMCLLAVNSWSGQRLWPGKYSCLVCVLHTRNEFPG